MSFTSPFSTPAWTAAPTATTSSGLTPLCGSLPDERVDELLDRRDPRRAADEDHVVDLVDGQPGVLHRLLERHPARLDEVGS